MFFKNASIYELDEFGLSLDDFENRMLKRRFKALNDTDIAGYGFEHFLFDDSERIIHAINDCWFFKYIKGTRTVPKDQLHALVERRVAELEDNNVEVNKQKRSDITDLAHAELLRVQPVKHTHISAYIDVKRSLLIINHKTDGQSEDVILAIRKALGSFRCCPIRFDMKPCQFINDWIALPADEYRIPCPSWLKIDFSGTIKGRGETDKTQVTSKGHAIETSAFAELAIISCDMDKVKVNQDSSVDIILSFTLNSQPSSKSNHNTDLKLTKLGFAVSDESDCDDEADHYNTELFLMTTELGTLIDELTMVFCTTARLKKESTLADAIHQAAAETGGEVVFISEVKSNKESEESK